MLHGKNVLVPRSKEWGRKSIPNQNENSHPKTRSGFQSTEVLYNLERWISGNRGENKTFLLEINRSLI